MDSPTPPEPPTTRTSLEEEEEAVLESWVDSEFVESINSSLIARSTSGVVEPSDLQLFLK